VRLEAIHFFQWSLPAAVLSGPLDHDETGN